MAQGRGYPSGASRGAPERFSAATKYGRHEAHTVVLDAVTAFAEVITFSGEPDAIDVIALDGAVEVRMERRAGQESSTLVVPLNTVYATEISRERVLARRFAVATPATVCIVGKWAEPHDTGPADDR